MTTPDRFARNDLATAWSAIHDARPEHWFVGQPMELRPGEWVQYAYDPRIRQSGKVLHAREWTAVATSELGVLVEMARCLEVIGGGGWPE